MERGKGLAVAGLVLALVGSLLGLILAWLVLLLTGVSHHARMFQL